MNRRVVAAFALAIVPFAATAANARQAGKAAVPAKPAAATPIEKRTFASLSELQQAYSDERDQAQKDSRTKELASLKVYLKGKIEDKEKALAAAQDIANELEQWADAKVFGEQFVTEFGSSKQILDVKLGLAATLTHIDGKTEDAKKLYEEVVDKAGDDKNSALNALGSLAEALMAADDIEGARKTYDRMAALVPGAQQIEQFVAQKKASLEMIGEEPKAFDVKDAAGQPLSLAKYKGKVVLLDFWATWCGPCRAELPNVIATYKKYHDKGFEIVGVSLDEDEQAFKDFIKSKGMTWSQFFDGKGWKNEVSVLYGVQSIPQTYLIDTSGKIYRIGLRGDALGRTVNALLAKSAKDPTKKP